MMSAKPCTLNRRMHPRDKESPFLENTLLSLPLWKLKLGHISLLD
jgi:hypothetical protein